MTDTERPHTRQYRQYSETLYQALADDPFYRALERNVACRDNAREAMLCYFDYSICEADRFGHLCRPSDKPVGVSLWSVPLGKTGKSQKQNGKSAAIRSRMGLRCLEVYQQIGTFMSAASAPLIAETDWYLSIVGVSPEFQGRGLGAELINPVLATTDARGISTYLETFTARNMPFYNRLGYRIAGRFSEPVTQADYWLMRRPPGSR